MKKFLVETSGQYQLVDFTHRQQLVEAHRPSVVEQSAFIQTRVAMGQLRVFGEVNAEATDVEFAAYWKDSESAELAIAAFMEAYKVEAVSEKPAPEAKKKADK